MFWPRKYNFKDSSFKVGISSRKGVVAMARAVRLVSRGTHKDEVCPCSERQLASAKKRKVPVLRENRYPELSEENSRPEDQASGRTRQRYIPPGNHPWRRFRLPGSPPDKKERGGAMVRLESDNVFRVRIIASS